MSMIDKSLHIVIENKYSKNVFSDIIIKRIITVCFNIKNGYST